MMSFGDASQSMDELLDRNNSLNVDENFSNHWMRLLWMIWQRSAIRPSRLGR
jgi:hypothetical protein